MARTMQTEDGRVVYKHRKGDELGLDESTSRRDTVGVDAGGAGSDSGAGDVGMSECYYNDG